MGRSRQRDAGGSDPDARGDQVGVATGRAVGGGDGLDLHCAAARPTGAVVHAMPQTGNSRAPMGSAKTPDLGDEIGRDDTKQEPL
jgi:hypothetical protein